MKYFSNKDLAIHVKNLNEAENFYGGILGFKLLSKNESQLSYDTGTFCLWINKDEETKSFIPSFSVSDINESKKELIEAGCKIIKEWADYKSFYAVDPFGIVIDVIEKKSSDESENN